MLYLKTNMRLTKPNSFNKFKKHINKKMKKQFLALGTIALVAIADLVHAQALPITSIGSFYQTSQTGNVSYAANGSTLYFGTNGLSNQNDKILQSFIAGGKSYVTSSLTPATVKFRRVDNPFATGNKTILFFEINDSMNTDYSGWLSSSNKYLKSSYMDSMELAFTGRTLNRGSDNTLGNLGNNQGNNNNIERIDIVFNSPRPILSNNGDGITVFERGTPTNHGGLKFALILSVDANGNPTSFSNIYTLSNSEWGATDAIPSSDYGIMNSNGSFPFPYKLGQTDAVQQSIGGVYIPYLSFGLSASATPTVYGYSIMAGDVTATTSAQILDYTNSSIFPTNTDGNDNTIGGMDLITVTMDFADATINPVNLSGNVFNDGNGVKDGLLNGTGINTASGQQLYVNVIDVTNGNVVATTAVAANGTWTIDSVTRNSNYTLSIGTAPGIVGSPNPGNPLPSNWKNTAEWIGSILPTTAPVNDPMGNGFLAITVDTVSVTNINFGLDRVPVANAQSYTLTTAPALNSVLVLNGNGTAANPGPLSGTDAEDGVKGSGSTFNIVTIPATYELWYNGSKITGPLSIPNYDPTKLEVHFTSVSSQPLTFTYTVTDNAGVTSAPQSYTIGFPGSVLPVTLAYFNASLQGDNVLLQWETYSEINTNRYIVEHSLDGTHYEALGSIAAKGNGAGKNDYGFTHTGVQSGNHYYRLRMDDMGDQYKLSDVRLVRVGGTAAILISPNPVITNLNISGANKGDVITITDITGRTVYTTTATANTAIVNFTNLPDGVYFLQIKDLQSATKYTAKVVKQ